MRRASVQRAASSLQIPARRKLQAARWLVVVAAVLLAVSCASDDSGLVNVTTPRDVEAAMRRYVDAFKTLDLDDIAGSYSIDAELLEPGMDVVRGRDAIRAFFAKRVTAGLSIAMETTSLETYGRNAYQWGTYRDRDGSGRYVAAWRQDEDGRWRIVRLLVQPAK